MTEDDDIDAIAGEYVLGTLDAAERASVAARRLREPALDAAIVEWESKLAPLSEFVAAVAPSEDAFAKIVARIDDAGPYGSAAIVHLRRRLNMWRATAIAASAIAASLVVVFGARELRPPPKQQLVAVLQKDASSPAFLVTVNIEDRVMTVQPVAAKPEAGKSYELWLVQDSLGAPRSLGVINGPKTVSRATLAAYKPDVIESATFAVSLEPEGGSPTGKPTGPVVFAGKLIPATR
jgi:anti-sigma-K factor RskA